MRRKILTGITLLWTTAAAYSTTPGYGPVPFAGGIRFRYYFPDAHSIAVAGDFNNWQPALLLTPMKSRGAFEGILPAEFLLKKTRYRYKLIINGIWQPDPVNPNKEYDKSGDMLSFFTIPSKMIVYSKSNPEKIGPHSYRFIYRNPEARSVRLTGSFNNFDIYSAEMKKDKNGVWVIAMQIFPGKQLYNFIVDGRWIIDPNRISVTENRFGRRFSVFTAH